MHPSREPPHRWVRFPTTLIAWDRDPAPGGVGHDWPERGDQHPPHITGRVAGDVPPGAPVPAVDEGEVSSPMAPTAYDPGDPGGQPHPMGNPPPDNPRPGRRRRILGRNDEPHPASEVQDEPPA